MSLRFRCLPASLRTALVAVIALLVLALDFAPAEAAERPRAEARLGKMVNKARTHSRTHHLRHCRDLHRVARQWSAHMARSSTLAHNPALTRQLSAYRALAENVGYAASARAVQHNLVASAPHRANMLSGTYTQMGIGVVRRGGTTWVTQVFRRPTGPTRGCKRVSLGRG